MNEPKEMTVEQWQAAGRARFGDNVADWAFVCPVCGNVAKVSDWRKLNAPEGAIAFSCLGRFIEGAKREAFGKGGKGQPCNYTGGGLFRLNPVTIVDNGERNTVFDFAPATTD